MQKLKEKVEMLAAQLSALTTQPFAFPSHASFTGETTSISQGTSESSLGLTQGPLGGENSFQGTTERLNSFKETSEEGSNDVIDSGLLGISDANSLFHYFQTTFISRFPFIILPPQTTADSLRLASPFLFLSIMAATTFHNPPIQRHLGSLIKRKICSQLIMRAERSLDLLQGLLVHLAWYHYFLNPQAPQMSLVLQLCIALVHELGIDKSPCERKKDKFGIENEVSGDGQNESSRSLEEKRALLGTYFLASSFAAAFRKHSVMDFMKYMEKCCQSLSEAAEFPSDLFISPMVQLQVLSRRVSDEMCYECVDSETKGEAALHMATGAFRRELEHLVSSIINIRDVNGK
jgi:hypothetical protein